MELSIAICTWNRAELLDRTLDTFEKLELPAGLDWELLVVNNGSSDDTDEVIARRGRHLPLRRLCEPRPGLSHARNLAATEARGELVVWTDDDVSVDPHWAAAYWSAARRYPEASFFGGTIDPWFESDPPN